MREVVHEGGARKVSHFKSVRGAGGGDLVGVRNRGAYWSGDYPPLNANRSSLCLLRVTIDKYPGGTTASARDESRHVATVPYTHYVSCIVKLCYHIFSKFTESK